MITNTPASHQALLPRQPLSQPKSLAGLAHHQWQAVAITADCSLDTPAATFDQQRAQQQKIIVGRHICNDVHAFDSGGKRAAEECSLEQNTLQLSIRNKSLNDSNTVTNRQLQLLRRENILLEEMLQFQARATGITLDPVHNNGSIFWGAEYPSGKPYTTAIDQENRQQLEQIVDRL